MVGPYGFTRPLAQSRHSERAHAPRFVSAGIDSTS